MAKEFSRAFYKSKEWRECREAYIKTVNGLCETCLEEGIIKPGKILHHKIYLTPENINDPEITLNWDNLKYECKECHDKHEGHGVGKDVEVTREGLSFNEYGELVPE
ncbi:MAG: HNH endonuclease [Halanaerobiales bacterium]